MTNTDAHQCDCGGNAVLHKVFAYEGCSDYYVECDKCGKRGEEFGEGMCAIGTDHAQEAVKAWNTRTPKPSVTIEMIAKIVANVPGDENDYKPSRLIAQAILTAFHVSRKE